MGKDDREILYQGYLTFFEKCTLKKSIKKKMAIMIWENQMDLLRYASIRARRKDLDMEEKKKLVQEVKAIFKHFCCCIKSYKNCVKENEKLLMFDVIYCITAFEVELFEEYRNNLVLGEKLELEKLLKIKGYLNQIPLMGLPKLVEKILTEQKNETVFKDEEYVYISPTGSKFHLSNCIYMKKRNVANKVPYSLAIHYGLEPCKCILKHREEVKDEEDYITVFIDESIRQSPWGGMVGDSNASQGVFSYIICQGRLQSEKEITKEKTIISSSGLLEEKIGSTNAAIETINNVLMKIAFIYQFNKDVIIYTDNKSASELWDNNEQNKYLITLFTSVKVIFIPREKNTVADKIGRKVSYFDVPTSVMEKIIYKCKVYDELAAKFQVISAAKA